MDYGGQQAAIAFYLVGFLLSAKDINIVKAKYSKYKGILALAACVVAAVNNN